MLGFKAPKNGPKNSPKFKKRRKMTKTTLPLGGDPIQGQQLGKNSFSTKVDFVIHLKIDQNGKWFWSFFGVF